MVTFYDCLPLVSSIFGSISPINISILCVRVHREKVCIDIYVNTILAMQAPPGV